MICILEIRDLQPDTIIPLYLLAGLWDSDPTAIEEKMPASRKSGIHLHIAQFPEATLV